MRRNIVKTSARNLRQTYLQQYLKPFLQRVHPDLFQGHPKEQLRNSTSLQDLLPLIGHEKTAGRMDTHPLRHNDSTESGPVKVIFYFKPKATVGRSEETVSSQIELESVEHLLPDLHSSVCSIKDAGGHRATVLEREIKSWQTVQSFLELCRKVGVSIKDSDQQDAALHLEQSVREATAQDRSTHTHVPQKPLSAVFEEELKSSFSGSGVAAGGEVIRGMYLDKSGAVPLASDAQLMIESNPLLFKGPTLSPSRLNKVVRTWIYWQEEDQQSMVSPIEPGTQFTPFRLSDWWRKVPVIILNSAKERAEMLRPASSTDSQVITSSNGPGKGILVVDQEMSKQGMRAVCYSGPVQSLLAGASN